MVLLLSLIASARTPAQPGGGRVDAPDPSWLPASYFPPWAGVRPKQTLPFAHDPKQSPAANGAALAAAIRGLRPGQALAIGPGTYSLAARFDVSLAGTAADPIWIVGADPQNPPVLTRPDNQQNLINVGSAGPARFVCFRDLDLTGGDDLMKLYDCENVWIDQCTIHDGDGVGIAANSSNTRYLYITRNEIARPGTSHDSGEGMYLGANYGAVAMSYSVVALNHVHDTTVSTQGDGIEVKQGSHHNWIAENRVERTRYPCILVYGTGGNGENVIERNVLLDSLDNTLQVQGEAIVRNNVVLKGAGAGFQSHHHQGTTRDLKVVHNTIINPGRGANLSSWNQAANVVFANNVVYSRTSESIRFPNGSTGVTLSGNVVLGSVTGASRGFVKGSGLEDFVSVTWDLAYRDARPAPGSAIAGRGDPAFTVPVDVSGQTRIPPPDPGAHDAVVTLRGDRDRLSVGSGGVQQLALEAGSRHGRKPYRLAGSLTGMQPGLPLGALILPLNPDPYLFFTALHPNTFPLSASAGVLDGRGLATARFTVPPGMPPSLVGLRLHHAFGVVGAGVDWVSNAWAVDLVK